MQSALSHRLINSLSATGVRAKIWLASGAGVGVTGFLLAFGLSHIVYGQVTLETEPAPQSANMRGGGGAPKFLPGSADLQARTAVAVDPFEWSANDKQLIVKPALLVMPERNGGFSPSRSFQVKLSSAPSGDVTVVVNVPTRLDEKLLLTTTSLSFTASNFDQFQEISVTPTAGSDTGDREEFLTLSASGGGYDSVEASVPIIVDQDKCARPSGYAISVSEGTSCAYTYACSDREISLGDYFYRHYRNGSATLGVDLIVNGHDSLEVTRIDAGVGGKHLTDWHSDQFVAYVDGIPEGDEMWWIHCTLSPNPPSPYRIGYRHLILDADGWAVGDTTAAESSGEMTFLLKFTKPVARDLSVSYQTKDGSATAGDDYVSQTGKVTVQKGGTSTEIRVPLIADNIAEGVEEFKLVTWSDQFRGIGRQESTGRILDPPGIQLQPNPLEVEEGSSATYQARLYVEPSDEVTVAISGYAGTDLSVEGTTSLTFMPFDFDTWKDVKVSTDIDADANPDKVTLTHTASGASEYAGVTADLEVTILDRYALGLKVTPTVLALKENGSDSEKEQDFTVRLGSPPVGGEVNVAVTVSTDLSGKATVDRSNLVYTSSNWSVDQTVTVTATDDPDANDESGAVDLTASGADYAGQSESVTVTVEDDEVTELIVSPEKLSLTEDANPGKEKSFKVRLNAAPAVPEVSVAVNVSTDLSGKATVDRSNLVYTSSNWSEDQTVTVTAVADSDCGG